MKGIPSKLFWQTTHVKQEGWYGFPVALRRSFLSTTNFLKISKPQDAVEDGLGALAALLQGVRVARLAQRLVVGAPVEGLVKEEIVKKYQIQNVKYQMPNI